MCLLCPRRPGSFRALPLADAGDGYLKDGGLKAMLKVRYTVVDILGSTLSTGYFVKCCPAGLEKMDCLRHLGPL